MKLVLVKSDKDSMGRETLDRIGTLTQEFETPCVKEEVENVLILCLKSNDVPNDFMHIVFLGEDLNNVSGEILVLQDGDPSTVEESLDQLEDFIINLCLHLGGARFLAIMSGLMVHDIFHSEDDEEDGDGALEARILAFKDKTTIKDIRKYFLAKQPKPNSIQ